MKLSDFDYELPRARIAQRPTPERDASRLLLVERGGPGLEDRQFLEFPDILAGDELLVVNNARVIPARLFGRRQGLRAEPPGKRSRTRSEFLTSSIEVLLTRELSEDTWEALVRPGRKMRLGERVVFCEGELEAEVIRRGELGVRHLRFSGSGDLMGTIERLGHVPLPPYIDRPDEPADRQRYQTVFARVCGAVAAPTAGLHFTPAILDRLRARGISLCEITLHVGLGTFQPIHAEIVEEHQMPPETYEISADAATQIVAARRQGRPIIAVGTTVVRALEDAAQKRWRKDCGNAGATGPCLLLPPGKAEAEIFIYPGYEFRVADQMLTNFHLPKSTLLVMVAAFAGRERILRAYRHAVEQGYRFYSYGDCMLIR